MSGGVAYVYAPDRDAFRLNCNLELVDLETVEDEADVSELKELVGKHANLTGSTVAAGILDTWAESLPSFVKVMPRDYKRALAEMAAAFAPAGASPEEALGASPRA
jgi:glutamate synthase (NADPH/NADH) large chain